MKSGQLIAYNMKNIFLEENYIQNVAKNLALDLFFNKLRLWINSLNFHAVCFYAQVEDYQNILKLRYRPLKAFLRN